MPCQNNQKIKTVTFWAKAFQIFLIFEFEKIKLKSIISLFKGIDFIKIFLRSMQKAPSCYFQHKKKIRSAVIYTYT